MKRVGVSNAIVLGALVYIMATRGPGWIESWKLQGASAPQAPLEDLEGQLSPFPPVYGKWLVVFWATWCGPCGIELDRLKTAASEGKIDPSRVLAVSIGEEADVVKKTVAERAYPFHVLLDRHGRLAQKFEVQVTPTVALLEADNHVSWLTSGLSPTLVWRAEKHIPPSARP